MYRLGLDIGTTSVGAAILNIDHYGEPNRIIDMHVRTFEAAENPNDGSSLAAPRREARGARRRNRRHKHRLDRIKALIQSEGIYTKEKLDSLYHAKGNILMDIYQIRYESLERKLNNEELTRLLIHFAQRRGFKSNRKNEKKGSDEGKLLAATADNEKYLKEKGYRTVGEMLWKDERFAENKRNKGGDYSNTFLRSQLKEEIGIIFEKQKAFGSLYVTDAFSEKYLEILFSQRAFEEGPGEESPYAGNQIEKMVGKCTFEKEEKRAPKATYTFELYNLWQKINSIGILQDGVKRRLTDDERNKLFALCHKTEKIDYKRIRKELEMGQDALFSNLTYGQKEVEEVEAAKFQYLPVYHEMRKAFNKISKNHVLQISNTQRDLIGTAITYYKTDDKIQQALLEGNFSKEEINAILGMKNFSKFGSLSIKAMQKVIPYLEKGLTYDKACEQAGYDFRAHSVAEKKKYLPKLPGDTYDITSPVVKRAINQTIKVVNEIIKRHGSPAAVNIELAREMSKSFKDRKRIEKEQKDNAAQNQRIYDEIKDTFHVAQPSGQDIVKYKLWQEQDCKCVYTGQPIKAENLFVPGYYEVDHIIPYSISFDDSYTNKVLVLTKANRDKGNRIPMQYVADKEEYEIRVNTLIKNRAKREKLLKPILTEEDMGEMKQRSLQDTQFITRFMMNYIKDYLLFDEAYDRKQRVTAVNGRVTAYMRKRWGINKVREDGDLHHSVDAVVVACITPGIVQTVTEYAKREENRYLNKDDVAMRERFPMPWPEFSTELDIRTCKEPKEMLQKVSLANYQDVDIDSIKPIFVSRMTKKKVTGQAHKETIRAYREVDGKMRTVTKTPIQELKLDKDGEIEGYYNPSSDILLYELLRSRLKEAGGNGKKAFPEGFVYKPTPNGGVAPKVKKVKICAVSSLNVSVNHGVAANGDMVRIDLYYVEGEGYYFIPIYISDLMKEELPKKACVPNKEYHDWKNMKDEDFLYSIYPNDLLHIKSSTPKKFTKNIQKGKENDSFEAEEAFVYYIKAGIGTGSITVVTHDNNYTIQSLGIKTLNCIEKYHVDVLGNKYKAAVEERK